MEQRIIGVLSGKGGVGKSTIAINMCALAMESKGMVLLVDADISNPCVGLHLGLWQSALGLQDVLNNKVKLKEAIIVHPITGIRLVPSSIEYRKNTKLERLKSVLEEAKYDAIIIDCPPGITEYTEMIIKACTEILVVVTPDIPSVTSGTKLIEMARTYNVKVLGVVVNRVGNKPYEMHPKEIETITETRACAVIPEDSAIPESIAAKTPVVFYKPRSSAGAAIAELSGIVFNRPLAPVSRPGLLSHLVGWLKSLTRH